jgi:predicted ArsR family transcriptional regulator
MTTARQRILSYITEQQRSTVEELSKVFRVTPANIRHHLSILVSQGAIKIIGQKTHLGKGRPTQIYSASQQSDRNNLEQLSDTLLTILFEASSAAEMNSYLRDVANQMANRNIIDRHNPTRQLYSTIRALNRMSYQAHWEAHVDTPHIMLGHCPYLCILDRHPEMCQLDVYLLQELLDAPVQQIEKLALDDKGIPECTFMLNQTAHL